MRRATIISLLVLTLTAACTADDPNFPAATTGPAGRAETPAAAERPCGNLDDRLQRARLGYVPFRSPQISLLPRAPNYIGSAAMPVHTGPWDFLAEVPLLFYGAGVQPGRVTEPATLASVAPTVAELIGFDGFEIAEPGGRALDGVEIGTGALPRLVVTVVWDGGGTNVLREHPNEWPFLRRLRDQGRWFVNAEVGSTPTNTPPIHTTIGTGSFPRAHGIPSVKMESSSGYIDPFEGNVADRVKVPSLGDVYDRALDNEPLVGVVATVNWHLGMIGHGASFAGGDRDVAQLLNDAGEVYGDPGTYELPTPGGPSLTAEADALDGADGTRDGGWNDHDLGDPGVRNASPAYVSFQNKAMIDLIERSGFGADRVPDLLYTNFKSIDDAGHRWGMTSAETAALVRASDDALRDLVAALDRAVGEDRWALVLTSDHGQNLYPRESGAWPIGGGELRDDANRALDATDDDADLIVRVTSGGAYVDRDQLVANDLSLPDVARWMAGYRLRDNVKGDGEVPPRYAARVEELLFDAALVRAGRAVVTCDRKS